MASISFVATLPAGERRSLLERVNRSVDQNRDFASWARRTGIVVFCGAIRTAVAETWVGSGGVGQ